MNLIKNNQGGEVRMRPSTVILRDFKQTLIASTDIKENLLAEILHNQRLQLEVLLNIRDEKTK